MEQTTRWALDRVASPADVEQLILALQDALTSSVRRSGAVAWGAHDLTFCRIICGPGVLCAVAAGCPDGRTRGGPVHSLRCGASLVGLFWSFTAFTAANH